MAILNILSAFSCKGMYSETSSDKRGAVILGHFALDKAFGTYHKLFIGVKLVQVILS